MSRIPANARSGFAALVVGLGVGLVSDSPLWVEALVVMLIIAAHIWADAAVDREARVDERHTIARAAAALMRGGQA